MKFEEIIKENNQKIEEKEEYTLPDPELSRCIPYFLPVTENKSNIIT